MAEELTRLIGNDWSYFHVYFLMLKTNTYLDNYLALTLETSYPPKQ